MPVDATAFRRALAQFATGVTVVTTRDAAGQPMGLTVNAFSAVSLDPPLVLVCIDRRSETHGGFEASGLFGVSVLSEGVHSGDASGVVPSSFRILRRLLSRLEDEATGKIVVDELFVEIPEQRLAQARRATEVLGTAVYDKFPFPPGITIEVDKGTRLVVKGSNRQLVGETAAQLIALRPPDSYKGKGIRNEGQHIKLKAGKTAKK